MTVQTHFREAKHITIYHLIILKKKKYIIRICRRCLPTRVRLLDRGVNCTSSCALCEGNYKDAIHVLFDCPKAGNMWRVSHLQNDVTAAMRNNNTVAEIVFHLIQNLPQLKLENFVTIVWSIWKSRNIQIWQNVSETYQAIF